MVFRHFSGITARLYRSFLILFARPSVAWALLLTLHVAYFFSTVLYFRFEYETYAVLLALGATITTGFRPLGLLCALVSYAAVIMKLHAMNQPATYCHSLSLPGLFEFALYLGTTFVLLTVPAEPGQSRTLLPGIRQPKATDPPVLVLITAPVIIACFIVFSRFDSVGGLPPQGRFSERQIWGHSVITSYRPYLERWLNSRPWLIGDVGAPVQFAPADGPNIYHGCFADGCFLELDLEVRGPIGSGRLTIPRLDLMRIGKVVEIQSPVGTWEYQGRFRSVIFTGQLQEELYGVEAMVDRFTESALKKNPESLLTLYDANRYELEKLPYHTRMRILSLVIQAAHQSGQVQRLQGLNHSLALNWADKIEFDTFIGIPEVIIDKDTELLGQFLSALRMRYPRHRSRLSWAERRFVRTRYFASKRISPYVPFSYGDDSWCRGRTEQLVGWLAQHVAQYVAESKFVQREIGGISKIEIDCFPDTDMSLSRSGIYTFQATFKIVGERSSGWLRVSASELKRDSDPVDPVAPAIRPAAKRIRLQRVQWIRRYDDFHALESAVIEVPHNER